MRLNDVPLNVPVYVREVRGDRPVVRRLLEMGLVPGTRVMVHRRAPLGDPMELSLRHYFLSLRADTASEIFVDLTPPSSRSCS